MTISFVKINEVTPYENNPRKNDNAVDKVAESIKKFGFQNPIIVDKNMVIIAGHTRYKASQKLGLKEIPVIVAENMTEEQAKAYRLVDNKTSEFAEWDMNALNAELYKLMDAFKMEDFGFDIDDISPDAFGEGFELPDGETPQTRTITLSLNEEQFQIATNVIEFVENNNLIQHDLGNHNKKSNALFEAVWQWAKQNNLL